MNCLQETVHGRARKSNRSRTAETIGSKTRQFTGETQDEAEFLAILAQPLNLLSLTFMSLVSPRFSANPCTAHLQSHNSADQTRKNSVELLITRATYGTPWWEVKGFGI